MPEPDIFHILKVSHKPQFTYCKLNDLEVVEEKAELKTYEPQLTGSMFLLNSFFIEPTVSLHKHSKYFAKPMETLEKLFTS